MASSSRSSSALQNFVTRLESEEGHKEDEQQHLDHRDDSRFANGNNHHPLNILDGEDEIQSIPRTTGDEYIVMHKEMDITDARTLIYRLRTNRARSGKGSTSPSPTVDRTPIVEMESRYESPQHLTTLSERMHVESHNRPSTSRPPSIYDQLLRERKNNNSNRSFTPSQKRRNSQNRHLQQELAGNTTFHTNTSSHHESQWSNTSYYGAHRGPSSESIRNERRIKKMHDLETSTGKPSSKLRNSNGKSGVHTLMSALNSTQQIPSQKKVPSALLDQSSNIFHPDNPTLISKAPKARHSPSPSALFATVQNNSSKETSSPAKFGRRTPEHLQFGSDQYWKEGLRCYNSSSAVKNGTSSVIYSSFINQPPSTVLQYDDDDNVLMSPTSKRGTLVEKLIHPGKSIFGGEDEGSGMFSAQTLGSGLASSYTALPTGQQPHYGPDDEEYVYVYTDDDVEALQHHQHHHSANHHKGQHYSVAVSQTQSNNNIVVANQQGSKGELTVGAPSSETRRLADIVLTNNNAVGNDEGRPLLSSKKHILHEAIFNQPFFDSDEGTDHRAREATKLGLSDEILGRMNKHIRPISYRSPQQLKPRRRFEAAPILSNRNEVDHPRWNYSPPRTEMKISPIPTSSTIGANPNNSGKMKQHYTTGRQITQTEMRRALSQQPLRKRLTPRELQAQLDLEESNDPDPLLEFLLKQKYEVELEREIILDGLRTRRRTLTESSKAQDETILSQTPRKNSDDVLKKEDATAITKNRNLAADGNISIESNKLPADVTQSGEPISPEADTAAVAATVPDTSVPPHLPIYSDPYYELQLYQQIYNRH